MGADPFRLLTHIGLQGCILRGPLDTEGSAWHVLRIISLVKARIEYVHVASARVLGYGRPIVEEAMSCTANRATLVGYGEVTADGTAALYRVPLPGSLERVTEPRSVTLTLAWFSPVNIRHRAYRRAKLEIKPDDFDSRVGVERGMAQPSDKSVPRGSLFHVHYEGDKAVTFVDDGHLRFLVFCREQGGALDQSIRYGLAVTVEAGENVPVYQEIRQRLGVQTRVAGSAASTRQ